MRNAPEQPELALPKTHNQRANDWNKRPEAEASAASHHLSEMSIRCQDSQQNVCLLDEALRLDSVHLWP